MRTKKKMPAALSAAIVLLCLVLLSAHFTSGMYARYTTRAQGSDKGSAADFNVLAESNFVEVKAGEDGYQITLTNKSNVSVSYKAVIQFVDSEDADRFAEPPVFTGELEPGGDVKTDPFMFQLTGKDGSGEAPFTVTVTFTQID